jgi:hypothetical protein
MARNGVRDPPTSGTNKVGLTIALGADKYGMFFSGQKISSNLSLGFLRRW